MYRKRLWRVDWLPVSAVPAIRRNRITFILWSQKCTSISRTRVSVIRHYLYYIKFNTALKPILTRKSVVRTRASFSQVFSPSSGLESRKKKSKSLTYSGRGRNRIPSRRLFPSDRLSRRPSLVAVLKFQSRDGKPNGNVFPTRSRVQRVTYLPIRLWTRRVELCFSRSHAKRLLVETLSTWLDKVDFLKSIWRFAVDDGTAGMPVIISVWPTG